MEGEIQSVSGPLVMTNSRVGSILGPKLDRLFRGIVPESGKYLWIEAENSEIERVKRMLSARLSSITHPISLRRKHFIPARRCKV